jgi:hypothetical protein
MEIITPCNSSCDKGVIQRADKVILCFSQSTDETTEIADELGISIGAFYKYAILAELQNDWTEPTMPKVGKPDS